MSGRKGVVELAAGGRSCGRQAMWEAMRRLRRFTLDDLGVRSCRETMRDYLRRLERGGYVTAERSGGRFAPVVYALVRDVGREAPRLTPDGAPSAMGRGRERMWRAMKMLGAFTFADLAVHAGAPDAPVAESEAKDYVKHLYAAGYLAVVRPAAWDRKAVYRLVRNTGPKPPMVTRAKIVWDPNLGEIAWHAEVDA